MSDQDNSIITDAVPAIETAEGPSQEWLSARRTTVAELEATKWAEDRTADIAASKILKQELGYEYGAYRTQLDQLSSDERLALIDKSADEIAAHLELRAEAERDQRRREEASGKQAEEHAEGQFRETPELRQVRHAMKTAYHDATSLDKRIAELQRLNEIRDDPNAKEWDDLPTEKWVAAREGKLASNAGEIAVLIQEKQAKLQEAALHQSAYHEGARASQAPPPSMPIGQIIGDNGQPVQLTRGDIAQIVQIERDQRDYAQRAAETNKQYPDWNEAAHSAARAGVDVTSAQAQFIITLPNGPAVAYHLAKNHADTRALAQMGSHEATRELIRLSHQLAARGAPTTPRQTSGLYKPPSPVGGGSSRAFDVSDESLSADAWFHQRNAQEARRKGR